MSEQYVTKVGPALRPLDHLLVSKRHLRAAHRWPWAWWCTCPDGYGAAKTEALARLAADEHTARSHTTEEPGR
ncbi:MULTISPECIES: hypothetical protein [unclassified Streptomyces]|uniref:hypothetical protein n=1 Tax=unclassified Streptomyces TaxID=2593676 RepID=UPI00225BEC22|nr:MULTISPECIES: hypothetical protein [unclassified Streptomyces]MCX4863489.1 hypothetical protein [Streptomyces sp. NBC_00906]MCX4894727.1 hypothetical protein [Streptomyces sp. NBC_00892]